MQLPALNNNLDMNFINDSNFNIQNFRFDKTVDNLKNDSENAEGLENAARGFEEFFINFMLNQMRQTIPDSGFFGDDRRMEIFNSMLDEQIAKACALNGSLGITELIESRLIEEYPERFTDEINDNNDIKSDLNRNNLNNEIIFKSGFFNHSLHNIKAFSSPLNGTITSEFGPRKDPFTGEEKMHNGIDISAPVGTPVKAVMDGQVVFSGYMNDYGNVVFVEHENDFISIYAHNSSNNVSLGDEVKKGQIISTVGDSGKSTGPHLHLGMEKNGEPIDPMKFIHFLRR